MNTQNTQNFYGIMARAARQTVRCAMIVAVFSLFAACSQTGIFASIENEETLKSATFDGGYLSLVRANPTGSVKIYLSNGYVWTKTASESSWTKIDTPSGMTCRELATDKLDGTGSLYGLFSLGSDWTADRSVRKWDGANWTTLSNSSSIEKIGSGNGWIYGFSDTGTVTGGNSEHLYNVTVAKSGNAGFDSAAIASGVGMYLDHETSAGSYFATERYASGSTTSQIWHYNGTTATAITSADISGEGASAITADVNDYAYVLTGVKMYQVNSTGVLWYSDNHGFTNSTAYQPSGLTVLDTATGTDYIIVSGTSGYRLYSGDVTTHTWNKTCITPRDPANYTSSLANYRVQSIWAIPDAAPSNGYVLFANIADTSKGGLWSYTLGSSWNRE